MDAASLLASTQATPDAGLMTAVAAVAMAPVNGQDPAADAHTSDITESDNLALGLLVPAVRVRRVLSETAVNHEQTVKMMAIDAKINELPNHKIAAKIIAEIQEFSKKNKTAMPDAETKRAEAARIRKDDHSSDAYKALKEESLAISRTQFRFSSPVSVIGAVIAEEIIRQNMNLALSQSKNRKVTVEDLLTGEYFRSLSLYPLYANGEHFLNAYIKFKNAETAKINKAYLESMKKNFKNVKTDDEIKSIADSIATAASASSSDDDDDDDQAEESAGFLTPKDFATYIGKICKAMIAERIKAVSGGNTPTGTIKMEKELKNILGYMCFDALVALGRAIDAYADNSKKQTLAETEFIKIVSIVLAVANVKDTEIFGKIALKLDQLSKLTQHRRHVAEKKAEDKLTADEKARLEAEKKAKDIEREKKKEVRAQLKELEKVKIAEITSATKAATSAAIGNIVAAAAVPAGAVPAGAPAQPVVAMAIPQLGGMQMPGITMPGVTMPK